MPATMALVECCLDGNRNMAKAVLVPEVQSQTCRAFLCLDVLAQCRQSLAGPGDVSG